MPIVQISILPQSAEKKAEISKVITDEIHRITGIRKEAMVILFYYFMNYQPRIAQMVEKCFLKNLKEWSLKDKI